MILVLQLPQYSKTSKNQSLYFFAIWIEASVLNTIKKQELKLVELKQKMQNYDDVKLTTSEVTTIKNSRKKNGNVFLFPGSSNTGCTHS